MKTKLYVLKATNDFNGEKCLFSAYLDEGEAMRALYICQTWKMKDDDLFECLKRTFEMRQFLDITEKYDLRDLIAKCPMGAHTAIRGMETASMFEMEFDFECEAMGEMAAINAEAGIRNVKSIKEIK
jgi:hypothetical protein